MNRAEAEALIGTPVRIWTAKNGTYVGSLRSVVSRPRQPWRGEVAISGVLEPACHYAPGIAVCRRGFRPGEHLIAGHSSITITSYSGTDYVTALLGSIARHSAMLKDEKQAKTGLEDARNHLQAEQIALAAENGAPENGRLGYFHGQESNRKNIS